MTRLAAKRPRTISMRDLQKLSARAIQSSDSPLIVRSGSETVGIIYPIAIAPRHLVEAAMDKVDAVSAKDSAEDKAKFAELVGDEVD